MTTRSDVPRRLAVSAILAVGLLGLAVAVISRTAGGEGDPPLNVAAGAPSPTAGATSPALPAVVGEGEPLPTTVAAQPEETVAPRRESPVTTVPEPVVRTTLPPATTPNPNDSLRSSPPLSPTPDPTLPSTDPSLAACPASGVRVTVAFDRTSYGRGETVRWSSTIENRSGTTCLMSGRAFFHVENTAGKTVGSFPYTMIYMLPVKAEPGKTITNRGSWDQQDCSGPTCVQVPAGTYVVVAGWTEGGPYTGRGSFQITG